MLRVDLIAGARPNFMKIAPIIDAIRKHPLITYRLVHTGQHYDQSMSGSFFEQLQIPLPDVNLEARGGTQAEQTAAIMVGYEKLLLEKPTDLCLVVGDVTSTMACAITAQKLKIDVAHVEGGIRSNDWTMPEEINRMVTDSISNYFFTTSATANSNLRKMGIGGDRIFFVGNTMIDTLRKNETRLIQPSCWSSHNLQKKEYLVMTLHRPANVDEENTLKLFIEEVLRATAQFPIVFPVHPRTSKVLNKLGINDNRLILTEPLGYLEFNYLVKHAKAVLTDSGGITEETTVFGVPCLTLRDNTERPETIIVGTNELVGTDPKAIGPMLEKLFSGKWKKGTIPEMWDGKTGIRIIEHLSKIYKLGN